MANVGQSLEAACDPGKHEVIPIGLRDVLQEVSFEDYVKADSSVLVCSALKAEHITVQVTGDNEEDEAPMWPSASQVMEAISVARLFLSFEEGEGDALRHVELWRTI